MHGPCLEAGRIQAKKKKNTEEKQPEEREKNRSDAEWMVLEEDVFPFSSIVWLIRPQSLSKRSQCTFELSLFMDIGPVFPREKIHAVSHEANTWGGRVN